MTSVATDPSLGDYRTVRVTSSQRFPPHGRGIDAASHVTVGLLGYVKTLADGDVGQIVGLAVAEYRRGIAQLLVKEAIRLVRRRGCQTVEVLSELADEDEPFGGDNDGSFWLHLGFERVKEVDPGTRRRAPVYLFRRSTTAKSPDVSR